jgi:transcriptional regulator of acetoin/glycerol metabolism
LTYGYPLNIRELEQAIRAAVALGRGGEIRIEHLPEAIRLHLEHVPRLTPDDRALRDQLIELMRIHQGNVAAIGRSLHKAPAQIRRWCRRLGIEISGFRIGS